MQNNFTNNGELQIIKNFISQQNVVFDLGANVGEWSRSVLSVHPTATIHLFEPIPSYYAHLLSSFNQLIESKQVFVNNCAISDSTIKRYFYFYSDCSKLSTFYRRFPSIEERLAIKEPEVLLMNPVTLDSYCEANSIDHIHFLKIDVEGAEFEAMKSADGLLTEGKIDFIQFEYGGTWLEADTRLQDAFDFLVSKDYSLSKITSTGLKALEHFSPDFEDFSWCNILAVNNKKEEHD
jgi:FkbM family methyltransferase